MRRYQAPAISGGDFRQGGSQRLRVPKKACPSPLLVSLIVPPGAPRGGALWSGFLPSVPRAGSLRKLDVLFGGTAQWVERKARGEGGAREPSGGKALCARLALPHQNTRGGGTSAFVRRLARAQAPSAPRSSSDSPAARAKAELLECAIGCTPTCVGRVSWRPPGELGDRLSLLREQAGQRVEIRQFHPRLRLVPRLLHDDHTSRPSMTCPPRTGP
jgi:hypothetical protein